MAIQISNTELNENLSKMTKAELMEALERAMKSKANVGGQALLVKRNASGGVFIRHPSFLEFSDRTQKDYVAGINIPANTAVALFSNPELLNQIAQAIKDI